MSKMQLFSRVEIIAQSIWKKKLYQHLLFASSTIIVILLLGYYFGTYDQAIHLPFLKKYADPTLFPNDKFLDLRFRHYSYFWFFFIPFYKIGVLEISIFIIHILTTYLTFWALWNLSKTLFKSTLMSFLTIIVFLVPHIGLSGLTFIEFSLLNRTFALPFILIAFNLYLRRKYVPAFFLLGLMYNIHVVSVNFALVMIFFDCILQYKKIGLKKILLGLFVFIIGAIPVLAWKFGNSQIDFTFRYEWYLTLKNGILFHLLHSFEGSPLVLLSNAGLFSLIILLIISCRRPLLKKYNQSIINFIIAGFIVILIQKITSQWLPFTIIIQSQIMRIDQFVLIFVYLYFIHYLVSSYELKKLSKVNFYLILFALIFSVFSFIPLIIFTLRKYISTIYRAIISAFIIIILLITTAIIFINLEIYKPEIHIFGNKLGNYNAQIWARNNTPKDAVFITPPHIWAFHDLEWRGISERSTVSLLSELLDAAFAPEYITTWKPRFESVAPGALEKLKGNFFSNIKIIKQAYYSLSEEDILNISNKYNAQYHVVEKPYKYNFPIVYEGNLYTIYKLK